MSIENFVDSRIFYSLIALLIISTGTVFAQEPQISVQTDDSRYDEGDTVVISGIVKTVIGETPIIIQIIYDEKTYVDFKQIEVAQDGSFTATFIAEGTYWKKAGTYTVKVSYQDQIAETEFTYTPESGPRKITDSYEVSRGPGEGTFDVKYAIEGGTVKKMIVDPKGLAIIVQIESTYEGEITLDLPREFIGAKKQDGKDDIFIITIDGRNVVYLESVVHPDSRRITINFENEDSDIEIIGTYVVPEFGTIVMMILIVGIMTVILVSRNKLQIKI